MSEHTPGPWGVEFCAASDRYHIDAGVYPFGVSVCELSGNKNDYANARLISTAPLGLALAQAVVAIGDGELSRIQWATLLRDARALIAQAEGAEEVRP